MKKKKMPSMFQPATQIADGTYESSQSTIVFTTGVICVPHTNHTSTRTAISKRAIPYWKTYHIFNKKEHVHVYTSTSVPYNTCKRNFDKGTCTSNTCKGHVFS